MENLREIGSCCWMICAKILWAGEWLDEFRRVDEDGKLALMLGKRGKGVGHM